MAKGSGGRRRIASHLRLTPYRLPSCDRDVVESMCPRKCSKTLDEDWEDATCSVCMECPHNAVLLLCSSYDKGCRPYMCGTSYRYSNCLDQYKNAYTKAISSNATLVNPDPVSDSSWLVEKYEASKLACPLCRGKVKGCTVVEPAREYLNAKKRTCMQDDCSFLGTYKELRKHMRRNHPSAQPRAIDPVLEQKWRRIEREREHNDVISTIRSTMPGAMVFGDYVIEGNRYDFNSDEYEGGLDADATERSGGFDRNLVNVFLLLHDAFGPSGDDLGRRLRQPERTSRGRPNESSTGVHYPSVDSLGESDEDGDGHDSEDIDGDTSLVSHLRRRGRVLLGRSGRRRSHREDVG